MSNVQLFYSVLPGDKLWLPHEIPAKLLIPSKSFVFNFPSALWTHVAFTDLTIRSTAGVWYVSQKNLENFDSRIPAGNVTGGLLVGTNSSATGIYDYNLGALITHGSGAGQLSYGAGSFVNPYTVGDTAYAAIRRNTSNLSANPINVAEIGWVGSFWGSGGWRAVLFARDIFSPAVNIGTGVTVQFVYTLQITA